MQSKIIYYRLLNKEKHDNRDLKKLYNLYHSNLRKIKELIYTKEILTQKGLNKYHEIKEMNKQITKILTKYNIIKEEK